MSADRPQSYVVHFLNGVVLALLGTFCFLYSSFTSNFAEIHIRLPFLNFPVFVGEFLLFICFIFFLLKIKYVPVKWNRWHGVLGMYFCWLLIKAFHGFVTYGPLAFRNAALFYYPLFALIGYYFYEEGFLPQKHKISLFLIFVVILLMQWVEIYYLFAYSMIFIILFLSVKEPRLRKIGVITGIAILFFVYRYLFDGNRSHLVGMFVSLLFLVFYSVFLLKNLKAYYKWGIVFLSVLGISMSICGFADKAGLKTLITPGRVIELFKEYDAQVQEKGKNFEFRQLSTNLYRSNKRKIGFFPVNKAEEKALISKSHKSVDQNKKSGQVLALADVVPRPDKKSGQVLALVDVVPRPDKKSGQVLALAAVPPLFDLSPRSKQRTERSIDTAYSNSIFRLFIWRDMLVELLEAKTIFGINFGKPQRSRSLEILNWGFTEWERDGWITPHNSFLHMIYRGGIVGIGLVLGVFVLLVNLIKKSYRSRSFKGALLISVLFYWMTISNFLVFLEFPHNAIPFWTFLGMTIAFCGKLKKKPVRV